MGACRSCGFENPDRFKFCGECGTALRLGPPSPTGPREAEAERRQLSVLFCDLVGSTALSRRHDPEEWREIVRTYHAACAGEIGRYGGYIAQYLGDGVLVYFGYPRAHEDEAARAVRAGLGIVEAMARVSAQVGAGTPLQVRVGIHTGPVVVGEMGGGSRREQLALGDTPNLAARLQELAQPDTVVISGATRRLIHGLFVCEDLGARTLRGFADPVSIYRVRQPSGMRGRFDLHAAAAAAPLVGRDPEVTSLLDAWEQVKGGQGRVVLLSGEPGIGKSRLVQALRERVAYEEHSWLDCQCSPYHQHSALHPVIDLLQQGLIWSSAASNDENVSRLERALRRGGFLLPETMPLFANLLGLTLPERYPPLGHSAETRREETVAALLRWVCSLARWQPMILVVDDLQWSDPSTLELLGRLLDQATALRVLLLLTFRPEFDPPWPPAEHVTPITLNRLTRRQASALIARIAGDRALPASIVRQIVGKTDGVPLFVEELTKMVIESSPAEEPHAEPAELPIPDTLQDSLMARLDRLGPVREIAQLAASIGREFDFDLLHAVCGWDEGELRRSLQRLVEADLVQMRVEPPQVRYLFRHALIRDAAYESQLKSRRREIHQRIAHTLRGRFAAAVETQPEILAHHYSEGGMREEAIDLWQRAGQRALGHSANKEAVAHLSRALDLLRQDPERPAEELAILLPLGQALRATRGYAAPEVERVYARARELCGRLPETPALFPVSTGLWIFYMNRADLRTAHEITEQVGRLAEAAPAPILQMAAHGMRGMTEYYLGNLHTAAEHLEGALTLYNPAQHEFLTAQLGQNPNVVGLSYLSRVLALLGYPERANQCVQQALAAAREIGHPLSLALAYTSAALIAVWHRDVPSALRWADAVIALSNQQHFSQFLAGGMSMRGWALFRKGQIAPGLEQLQLGEQSYAATGAQLGRPDSLAWLAEARMERGALAEAERALAEAIATAERSGEQMTEAELYRLAGELNVKNGGGEAEACFRRALEIARRQDARLWELRAATSLARMHRRDQQSDARDLLRDLCTQLGNGPETADLQEARTLLQQLGY